MRRRRDSVTKLPRKARRQFRDPVFESVTKAKQFAFSSSLSRSSSGEGGIRTLEQIAPLLDFESSAFNHSATSPVLYVGFSDKYLFAVAHKSRRPLLAVLPAGKTSLRLSNPTQKTRRCLSRLRKVLASRKHLRRRWDSNPRRRLILASLAVRCLRPAQPRLRRALYYHI